MKLIRLTRNFRAGCKSIPEYRDEFRAMKKCLVNGAAPGVPYNMVNILQHLGKNNLMDYSSRHYKILCLVLENLITRCRWYEVGGWGQFCAPGDAKPKQIIDGDIPMGVLATLSNISKQFTYHTGVELEPATLRKILERLTNQGRFVRMERGKYKRIHIGF